MPPNELAVHLQNGSAITEITEMTQREFIAGITAHDTTVYWQETMTQLDTSPYAPAGNKVWRNFKDYGARGDGVTDDTVAIQQANPCMRAKYRYGYIQTNHAMVAVCFAKLVHGEGPTNAVVESVAGSPAGRCDSITLHAHFMPVPWNTEHGTSGGVTLNTEMALWRLCMLALADRPRGLEPVDQVVPIDTWVPALLDDGVTWAHRYYYSNFDRAGVRPAPMVPDEENSTVAPASVPSIEIPGTDTELFGFHFDCAIDDVTGSLWLRHSIDF